MTTLQRKPRAKNGEADTTKVLSDLGPEAYAAVRKIALDSDLPMSSIVRLIVRHSLHLENKVLTTIATGQSLRSSEPAHVHFGLTPVDEGQVD